MTMPKDDRRLLDEILKGAAAGDDRYLTAELTPFFDAYPEAVIETLEHYARELGREEDEGNPEGVAVLGELLGIQLQHLRFDLDRGYDKPREIKERFERRAIELVQDGTLPGSDLSLVLATMTEAGLEPGTAIQDLEQQEVSKEFGEISDPAQLSEMMATLAEFADEDSFAMADAMLSGARTVPAQVRGLLASSMLRHPLESVREAAALLALDRDADVRRACALAFLAHVQGITPTALRRLIVARSWVPEGERHLIDQVVRAARTRGVEIAPAPAVSRIDLRCSGIDGSGAQGFMILAPERDAYRLVSVLTRYGVGVIDAWCGETGTKRALLEGVESAGGEIGMSPLRRVKRDYLDRLVGHHLAAGLAWGTPPPVGLLQVAEAIGTTEWRPQPLDWRETVDQLLRAAPARIQEPDRVAQTMRRTDWIDPDGLLDGWFEDGPAAMEIVRRVPAEFSPEAVDGVIGQLLELQREKWAAHFAWIALWLHEGAPNRDPAWIGFALLARELDRGAPIAALPLMRMIGLNTIQAMMERIQAGDQRRGADSHSGP